ncbi:FadR/GntR family transcriptional regulator [Streptomyces sp. NPDC056983]|uniref:FadR/GntR family transcriptional regulator n=1 Tax=Streptomyces sp. NPDC056983 TaxID=3345987 RepID=UPI0036303FD3
MTVVKKIWAPKPYDLLAEQLREAILGGDIAEGQALPTERELVEQTGLTRGSVREALKQLSAEGLVETRPGRFGGNIATLPDRDNIANSIGQFVRGRRLPLRTLHETRDMLEPALARLAAVHRTDEKLSHLHRLHEELVASVDSFHVFSRMNMKWHRAVASAAGNDLLSATLEAISFGVAVSTTIDEYDTPETRGQVIRAHGKILAAIESGEGHIAERRMRRHISATHARATDVESTDVPLSLEE